MTPLQKAIEALDKIAYHSSQFLMNDKGAVTAGICNKIATEALEYIRQYEAQGVNDIKLIDAMCLAAWGTKSGVNPHLQFSIMQDALDAIRPYLRTQPTPQVDYHAAAQTYVRLGFDGDGKTIEGNIYDLIKQVVDAALQQKNKEA